MIGIGTIVNAGAIVAGGLLGLTVGSLISRRVQATLVSGMAVGTMFIGAGATFSKMLISASGDSFETRGALMLVMSLAAGAVAGELVDIDGRFERGVIYGTGAYEKGAVKDLPVFQEAYEAGKNC